MTTSKPNISENELLAYVDGQLDESRAKIVADYLQQNPAEANRITNYQQQNSMLQSLYGSDNTDLLSRVSKNYNRPTRSRNRLPLSVAASVTWLVLGVALGWGYNKVIDPVQPAMVSLPQTALLAHAVFSPEVRHPVEVGADQEAHLVKWLSKRLGRTIRTPNLLPIGYSLVGGRLLPAQSGPAAQFMFQNSSGERLTLYVITEAELEKDTAFRFFERNNIKVFYWSDAQMGFALSGAITKQQLLEAANRIYTELTI